MKHVKTVLDYEIENEASHQISFVGKIVEVSTNLDTAFSKASKSNVTFLDIRFNYCIYAEAIANGYFDNFPVSIQYYFSAENKKEYESKLKIYNRLLAKNEAILLNSNLYTVLDGEIAVYEPKIEPLGFTF